MHGEGISRESDLLDMGVAHGIIEKSGSWLSYAGERLGQGRENVRQMLKENDVLASKIEEALRATLGMRAPEGTPKKPAGSAPSEPATANARG
jgi:recombination protein RecA